MPRAARVDIGEHPYHVINRAVMRLQIFNSDEEYLLFEQTLEDAVEETGMGEWGQEWGQACSVENTYAHKSITLWVKRRSIISRHWLQ